MVVSPMIHASGATKAEALTTGVFYYLGEFRANLWR
jgi:hypothetical protein